VSNQIERLRYFDGEYLRSFDFTDEQSYHVEIRRRLNHRLHLHGIVYGLQLVQDQDSPPPPATPFFSIAPGMAIDQQGREIFLPAPYSLSAENVLNRAGLTPKDNELWLCYKESPAELPTAGYRDCNQTDQNTRWQESFQISLKPLQPTQTSLIPPDCGGVRLGTVTLDNTNGWQIVDARNVNRTYVGIRAQRMIAASEEPDTFDMRPAAKLLPAHLLPGYVDVLPGVFARGNMFVKKNLVIGDDFQLDPADKNLPKKMPDTGNLKVTSDLFLNGDFYGFVGGQWFVLKDYIQTLMPDIVVGPPLTIPIPQGTKTSDVASTTVTTKLAKSSAQSVLLSITDMEWQAGSNLAKFTGGIQVQVSPTISQTSGGNTYNLAINWTVSPSANFGGTDKLPITNLVVSYVVIFQP
jgi:hypothetical protein